MRIIAGSDWQENA